MSNRHRTVNSHSITPSENGNDEYNNQIENTAEFFQCQTSVEPKINPNKNIQQNPLQIPKCPFLR